jgi:hypothetical protein
MNQLLWCGRDFPTFTTVHQKKGNLFCSEKHKKNTAKIFLESYTSGTGKKNTDEIRVQQFQKVDNPDVLNCIQ